MKTMKDQNQEINKIKNIFEQNKNRARGKETLKMKSVEKLTK